MPRYGNKESIQWFDVQPSSAFHIVNCFEDGDEVLNNIINIHNFQSLLNLFVLVLLLTLMNLHLLNSCKVVMWACRALGSIIPGPDLGLNRFEYFSNGFKQTCSNSSDRDIDADGLFFSRCYEWRLNMKTGEVKERNLSGTKYSMDFPMINENHTGIRNKFAYTQIIDTKASSAAGTTRSLCLSLQFWLDDYLLNPPFLYSFRHGKIWRAGQVVF